MTLPIPTQPHATWTAGPVRLLGSCQDCTITQSDGPTHIGARPQHQPPQFLPLLLLVLMGLQLLQLQVLVLMLAGAAAPHQQALSLEL